MRRGNGTVCSAECSPADRAEKEEVENEEAIEFEIKIKVEVEAQAEGGGVVVIDGVKGAIEDDAESSDCKKGQKEAGRGAVGDSRRDGL